MTKNRSLLVLFIFISAIGCYGQTSWLDRPLDRNWNTGNGVVPNAPRTLAPIEARCQSQIRPPESIADRAVTRAGWSLFGAAQVFGKPECRNGQLLVGPGRAGDGVGHLQIAAEVCGQRVDEPDVCAAARR